MTNDVIVIQSIALYVTRCRHEVDCITVFARVQSAD